MNELHMKSPKILICICRYSPFYVGILPKKQGFYSKTDQLGIVFMAQLPRKKKPNRIANENKRISISQL